MLEDLPILNTKEVKPQDKKDKRLFTVIPYRAITDKHLTPRQFTALCLICSYADKKGNAWPGSHRLAKDMGISQSTMMSHIQALTEKGYLITMKRTYKVGEKGMPRAVVFDPDNPPNPEDWQQANKDRTKEEQAKLDQQAMMQEAIEPVSSTLSSELALFSVWNKLVSARFKVPVPYIQGQYKDLTPYTLEDFEKATVLLLDTCTNPPGSPRAALRYLRK